MAYSSLYRTYVRDPMQLANVRACDPAVYLLINQASKKVHMYKHWTAQRINQVIDNNKQLHAQASLLTCTELLTLSPTHQ
jgi:hypothetical protein